MSVSPRIPSPPLDPLEPIERSQPGNHQTVLIFSPDIPSEYRGKPRVRKFSDDLLEEELPEAVRVSLQSVMSAAKPIENGVREVSRVESAMTQRSDLSQSGKQQELVRVIDAVRQRIAALPERFADAIETAERLEQPPKRNLGDMVTESREREIRDAFARTERVGRFGYIRNAVIALEKNPHDVGARELLSALVGSPHFVRSQLLPGDIDETMMMMRTVLDPERARAIAWARFAVEVMQQNVELALDWLETKRSAFGAPTVRERMTTA